MSKTTERPREIELYIARRIKRLDDAALVALLKSLRNLATAPTKEAHHV
ncbi:MAG: hypothetical protein K9L88_18605 [Chromatiaceae bacterium]|nr:hypothetical protein [Chromatiaceae bacterium]